MQWEEVIVIVDMKGQYIFKKYFCQQFQNVNNITLHCREKKSSIKKAELQWLLVNRVI